MMAGIAGHDRNEDKPLQRKCSKYALRTPWLLNLSLRMRWLQMKQLSRSVLLYRLGRISRHTIDFSRSLQVPKRSSETFTRKDC